MEPVPLAAIQPDGSLIYDPAPTGFFHAEGDEDDIKHLSLFTGQVQQTLADRRRNVLGLLSHWKSVPPDRDASGSRPRFPARQQPVAGEARQHRKAESRIAVSNKMN